MSLCGCNVLSSWAQPSRALVIQGMAPEWHVNLYALTQFNLILIKPFTSAKCAVRQRCDPSRGFWGQSVGPEGRTKKTMWLCFSGNFWNIKENLGSSFTLKVFIFRKTEHRQPIKICVHWGIPVSWHDNLLFKCTAAFLPYTTEQSRQLIHYHWAPFFLSLPPRFLHEPLLSALSDHCSCPTVKNLTVFCCWTYKLDWTKSNSAGLSQRAALHTKVDFKRADIWRCYWWWINPKKIVLQV